eukprot:scaffold14720_cov172-Ochromonas_danica.AAC.11
MVFAQGYFENLFALIFLAVIVYISYENALPNQFTFDDHLAIENNGDVTQEFTNMTHIWSNDIWGKDLHAHDSHKSYRPLLIELFRFLWHLSSSASLFRYVSLASHIFASFWVYTLSCSLTGNKKRLSLAAAAFFAAHPVHVEAVTAVVNLAESLYTSCLLLAFLSFLASYQTSSTLVCLFYMIFWVLFTLVATLFKETGVVSGLLVVATLASRQSVQLIAVIRKGRFGMLPSWRDIAWYGLSGGSVYVLAFPLQAGRRDSYLGSSQLIRRAENPLAFLSFPSNLLSTMYLWVRYFGLFLYPSQQAPEYSFDCIPAVKDVKDERVALIVLLIIILGLIILFGLYLGYRNVIRGPRLRSHSSSGRREAATSSIPSEPSGQEKVSSLRLPPSRGSLSFSLLDGCIWLLVPFLPASGLVFRLGTLLAERLMYLPSVGYCLLLTVALHLFAGRVALINSFRKQRNGEPAVEASEHKRRRRQRDRVFYIFSALVLSYYIHKCRQYNGKWFSDETLFLHTIEVCPNSAKAHLQVSKLYSGQQKLAKAWEHLEISKRIDPEFCDTEFQEAYLYVMEANQYQTELMKEKQAVLGEEAIEEHRQLLNQAAEVALKNLPCIYTNRQSLELLQKLWQYQLDHANTLHAMNHPQSSRNNNPLYYQVLADQAKQCYGSELFQLAAKKYTDLSVSIYDNADHEQAFRYALLANKALNRHYNTTQTNSELAEEVVHGEAPLSLEDAVIYNTQCRLWTLLVAMSHPREKLSKRPSKEVRFRWMTHGASRSCLFLARHFSSHDDGGASLLSPTNSAAEHWRLSGSQYLQEVQGQLATMTPDEVLRYMTVLTASLALSREEAAIAGDGSGSGSGGGAKAPAGNALRRQVLDLWYGMGQKLYVKEKDFNRAAQVLAIALAVFASNSMQKRPLQIVDAVLSFASNDTRPVRAHVAYWMRYNSTLLPTSTSASSSVPSLAGDCSDLYL